MEAIISVNNWIQLIIFQLNGIEEVGEGNYFNASSLRFLRKSNKIVDDGITTWRNVQVYIDHSCSINRSGTYI